MNHPPKRRASPFRQADVTRAIKAAKAAGMTVTRCEISADGSIVLTDAPAAPSPEDAFATWKAKREGRVEGRS
ncbi:hypothetical protein G5V65_00110 [Rhodobacter sp. HX-7-19]|uniref:Uncharacterized protein n=1 Tax=Paragemmobacter kunshanensis TaxID=2583234 RepID=A0A6M1U6E9_9RHOB|nr:hypothetical protein [Rhodobacter kunshanensis]